MDQIDQSTNNEKRSSKDLHPVQNYFDFDSVTNISTCSVPSCSRSIPGRHSNNLTRHIQRHHTKLYEELNTDISEYQNDKKKRRSSQNYANDSATVKINKVDFQNGLLELINLNGRPFSLFNDSGMRKILDPILAVFKDSRIPVSISRESLQNQSTKKSSNLTQRIKKEMADIPFSICIDIGTSTDSRSILGINTQYAYNSKMSYRCLAMSVHRHSNTGLRIAVLVWHTLNKFDLKLKNMLSVTSDNGANVLKSIRILRVFQTGSVNDYLDNDLEKIDYESLENIVDIELKKSYDGEFPFGIRCFPHTMNLCLEDALEGELENFYQSRIYK